MCEGGERESVFEKEMGEERWEDMEGEGEREMKRMWQPVEP